MRSRAAHNLLLVLIVWIADLTLAVFVEPNYDRASSAELIYYSVYNVAVAAFVCLHLVDRIPSHGLARFAVRALLVMLFGTLVNESLVEPQIFGTAPINLEGTYHGLADSVTTTALFLLLRVAGLLATGPETHAGRPDAEGVAPQLPASEPFARDSECFFVRVAGGTRRISAADVVYLQAERDCSRIVCTNGEHFASESLKNVLERTAGCGLARVHKSFAVNLRRVERVTATKVWLGDQYVPVGRRFREAFSERWRTQRFS